MAKIEDKRLTQASTGFLTGSHLSLLIIVVIFLVYLIVTIIGFNKINRTLDEVNKERINYEGLSRYIENIPNRQANH